MSGSSERIELIWRQLIEGYGMQLRIEELIGEGNLVAARFTETGTFRAPAFGHEPTGRSYGQVIQRRWGARDSAAQARQLGLPFTP